MTTFNWKTAGSGDWNTPQSWDLGSVPNSGSADAVIALPGAYTVTIAGGESFALDALRLNDTAAVLEIAGTLSFNGIVNVLALQAGTLQLENGAIISGGTISQTGGAFTAHGGTLSGVVYAGTLDLSAANSALTLTGDTTFTPGALINLSGGAFQNSYLYVLGSQTLDNATIDIGNGGYGNNYIVNQGTGAVLTLGPNLTIDLTGAVAALTGTDAPGDGIVNDGTILAAQSGATFTIDATNFANDGSIAVSNGAFIDLTGAPTAGLINSIAKTTGGTVRIGGIVNGGTITAPSGGVGGAGGTLSGVGYIGTLDLSAANSALTLTGDTTFAPGALINLSGGAFQNSYLYVLGSQTLDNATIDIGNGGYGNNYIVNQGTGAVLTLGPNLTIDLTGAVAALTGTDAPGDGIVNDGTILAAQSGATFTIDATNFANDGSIAVSNGAFIDLTGAPTAGLINSIAKTTGGTVRIGGTVNGGSITAPSGGVGGAGGTLSGVTYAGTLDLSAANSSLTLTGDTTFAPTALINLSGGAFQNSYLYVLGSQTLDNATIDIGNGGYGNNYIVNQGTGAVLTLGPNLTIDLTGAVAALTGTDAPGDGIVNDGTILAAQSGATFTIDATNFANDGSIAVSNGAFIDLTGAPTAGLINSIAKTTGGTVRIGGIVNGGTITAPSGGVGGAGGTLSGVTYAGTLDLSAANSALTLTGNTTFAPDALINLSGGAFQNSYLYVLGSQTLDNATIDVGNGGYGNNYIVNQGTGAVLTLGANLTIVQNGPNGVIASDNNLGDGIVNNGTIIAANASGALTVTANSFTNNGTIIVSSGGRFLVQSTAALRNLTGATLTGGTYIIGANSTLEVAATQAPATLDANLTLQGPGSAVQIDTATTSQIDADLTTIGTAGHLSLLASRNLTTANSLTDAGTLTLGGGTLTASGLAIVGSGILNGFGTIAAPISSAGQIEATANTLDLQDGASGNLQIDNGSTLELGAATTGTITFQSGGSETLALANPTVFSGTLAGLSNGDIIDLLNTGATSARLSGSDLFVTVSGATHDYKLAAPLANLEASVLADAAGTGSNILISQLGYSLAQAQVNNANLNFGNVRQGAAVSTALSITNAAQSPAESLDADIQSVGTGAVASGTITLLPAGGSDSTSLMAGIDTSSVGVKDATVTLGFTSDGTGTDGAAATQLPSQPVTVTGTVYRVAVDQVTAPANVIVHVGDGGGTYTEALTVTNAAPADSYSEGLRATAIGANADSISLAGLDEVGSAHVNGAKIQLTNGGGQAGAAWLGTAIAATQSFDTTFSFSLTSLGQNPQADGIAFVIQGVGPTALGAAGGDIGLLGLAPNGNTAAIVFQSWVNNHAGIVLNGNPYTAPISLPLGDASVVTGVAEVAYDATSHSLTLTSTEVLDGVSYTVDQTQSVDLATYVGPSLTLGFTGGTGGSSSDQDITAWHVTSSSLPGTATTALTASGSTGLLAAGQTDGTSLTATVSTAIAGTVIGSVQVAGTTDGTNVDGLGVAAIGTVDVPVVVTIDNYATAALIETSGSAAITQTAAGYTVNLGQIAPNSAPLTVQLGIENAATGAADLLQGSFTGASGDPELTFSGFNPFSGIAAGGTAGGLDITLNTSQAGVFTQQITLLAAGSNSSGYSAALTPETITVTGSVGALALVQIDTPSPIDFGDVRQGTAPALQPIRISNAASAGGQALDATATATGAATVTGAVSHLAAGATDTGIQAGLNTGTIGVVSGDIALAFVSDSPGGPIALTNQDTDIQVTGTVFAAATAALSVSPNRFVHVGDSGAGLITVTNTAPLVYGENLEAAVTAIGGSATAPTTTTGPAAAGTSTTIAYTLDTTTAGVKSGTVSLALTTDGTGIDNLGTALIGTATATVNLTVNNYATAGIAVLSEDGPAAALTTSGTNQVLNLGTIAHNSGAVDVQIAGDNAADGPADLLSGTFLATGDSAFTNSGLAGFSNLAAGQQASASDVLLSTDNDGTFTETVTLNGTGSNPSGYSGAVAPETLTITGTVADLPTPTITNPGSQSAFTGVAASIPDIAIADPDADGTFTAVVSDVAGALSAVAAGAAKISSQNNNKQLTISGSLADVNMTLASLTFLAASAGGDTIHISVTDGHRAQSSTDIAVAAAAPASDLVPVVQGPSNLTLIADQSTGVPGIKVVLPPGADPNTIYSLNISSPGAQLVVSGGPGGTVTGQGTDNIVITGTVDEINSYLDDGLSEAIAATFKILALILSLAGNPNGAALAENIGTIAEEIRAAARKKDEIQAAVKAAQAANEAEEIAEGVHVVAGDGSLYQLDSVGEFTLSASTQPGSVFDLQIRTAASNGSTVAAVVTAVAAGFGADTVEIDAGTDAPLLVNGVQTTLAIGATYYLAAGEITRSSDSVYTLSWNTGESATVYQNANLLNLSVGYGVGDTAATITGIVGPGRTGDGLFVHADGSVPTGQVTGQGFRDFVNSYRVSDATSRFTYAPGQSTASFTDLSAPSGSIDLSTLPAAVLALAQQAVQAAGITDPGIAAAAELDFLLSGGDPNVVQTDAELFAGQTTTAPPLDAPPAVAAFGIVSEAGTVTTDLTGAATITFMVYLTGTAATDTVINYSVVVPDDTTDLDATAFGGTLPTGSVTIKAGQSTAEIAIPIPAGALGGNQTENLVLSATPQGNVPVINTTATVQINQPMAGSPPVIAINNLAGFGNLSQDGNTYTLDLGTIPYSAYAPQIDLSIGNTAANGSDDLGGTFQVADVIGFNVTGASLPAPIQAGNSYNGLQLAVNEAKFGANSETIVFNPTDTNSTGYSAPLAPITINIDYTLEAPTMAYSQAWGDVHIITYNDLEYNFQAVGEFVLAHSTYPGDNFDIQLRLQPYNGSSSVTVITEVALQIGSDRVTFGIGRAATVWLNGVATTLDPTNNLLSLAGGKVQELSTSTYKVTWSTGETATITDNGTYFNVVDGIPTVETGFISGLQGENEGQQNDFQLADGTVLQQPLSAATLYGLYANSWRVSPATSLFDYAPGQTTATFTNTNFPLNQFNTATLPTAVQTRAADMVAAAGITDPAIAQAAIEDYLATGDQSLIASAVNAQDQAGTTTGAVVTPSAPPAQAIAVTAEAVSVLEATGGPTNVVFDITLADAAAEPLTVDYAVVAPDATFLGAAAFGGSLPSGSVTFAAGQASAAVVITLPTNVLGLTPDANVELQVAATDNTPVAIPVAQTAVVNPMPEAGPPAQAAFINETPDSTFTRSGNAYTLDLGTILQGATGPLINVALANIAAVPADSLSGVFGAPMGNGFVVTGNDLPAAIAAGGVYTGLFAAVKSDTPGAHSETITFTPEDTNSSGFQAAQAPITLTIEDVIGASAAAALNTPSTIIFPNVRVDTKESQAVSISNTAAPPAAALDVNPVSANGATVTGAITGLAAGGTDASSIRVGLDTTTAGSKSGIVTLAAASETATGSSALPDSPIIDVFGAVYREAAASVAPVNAFVHVGDTGTIDVTVANADPNDGFSEALIAAPAGVTGPFTDLSPSPTSPIAASASAAITLAFSTATAGVLTGSISLGLASDGGTGPGSIDGLGTIALAPVSAAVTVTVDQYAQAAFEDVSGAGDFTNSGTAYTLNLGTVLQGSAPLTANLGVINAAIGPADTLSGQFVTSGAGALSVTGLTAFSGLAAGQADTAIEVALGTATTGTFTQTVTLTATGSNASGYSGALPTEVLTITGTVAADTAPVLSAPGGITTNAGAATPLTGIALTAGSQDPSRVYTVTLTDAQGLLSAAAANGVTETGNGSTSLALTGTRQAVNAALGTVTDTDSRLTPDTITVTARDTLGNNAAAQTILVGHTFYLTKATDTVSGGPGPDTIVATADTLSAGDTVNGNGGTDTLVLNGAGRFNLAAPTALNGISEIIARDGQSASGTGLSAIPASNQIIVLRNGMDTPVVVEPDQTYNPANPHPDTITITGAQNAATLTLGSGADVVSVGDARETVIGGSGNDTIIVTAATIGAHINGGTGSATLDVTGGGGITMGSSITNIANVVLGAAATPYNFTANALSGLTVTDSSSGADTIQAGAANQTLTGGSAGKMTFIGSGAAHDVFTDTTALFRNDTISNFLAGDLIDITDLPNSPSLSIGFAPQTGLLTVTSGSVSTVLHLPGPFTTAGFTHTSDGGHGVILGYQSA